jgi:hypothetical protein
MCGWTDVERCHTNNLPSASASPSAVPLPRLLAYRYLLASSRVKDSMRSMSWSNHVPLKPQSSTMDRQYTALAHDGPSFPALLWHDNSNTSAQSCPRAKKYNTASRTHRGVRRKL